MKKQKTKYKRPNPLLYGIVRLVSKLACTFLYRLKVRRNELTGSSGRRVLICNHQASIDFLPVYAAVKERQHMVASRSIVMSIPVVAPLAQAVGVICKNQFQTNITDMRKMKLVVDQGALLTIFPAGLMTESGASTPIPRATAKALKWLDADLYMAKVEGTYLTCPKWAKTKRRGRITLDIYKVISRQELAALTVEEADALVDEHLAFDAYRANQTERVPFRHGDDLEGLEQVLYRCPHCGGEFTLQAAGNTLTCAACGYQVVSDVYGRLTAVEGYPTHFSFPSDWYAHMERTIQKELEEDSGFCCETMADVYKINKARHRYEKVGRAAVTMTAERFTIDGVLGGEAVRHEIPTAPFPILPFQPGRRFELQWGSDIFRICPDDGAVVMKWILTLKALYRIRCGISLAEGEKACYTG